VRIVTVNYLVSKRFTGCAYTIWYTGVMDEYIRNPNTKCTVCEKPVYRRPVQLKQSGGRAFCGQSCYGIASRKEIPCVMCSAPILASAHKRTCSRSCSNKYRVGIKYKIGRPRDKAQEIRAIKIRLLEQRGGTCERCGYAKIEILHVHHKDQNRKNNDFANLELICPNCHYEEHYLEKS
jgi:5-methylcytosine-specific restriction endonuclease McrA